MLPLHDVQFQAFHLVVQVLLTAATAVMKSTEEQEEGELVSAHTQA